MKSNLKKYLIIGLSIAVPIGIVVLSTSLYFTSKTIERISKKGIYSLRVNETLNDEGYKYDMSATYGAITNTSRTSMLLTNEILRLKTEGEFKYDQQLKKVIQPSYESYKFGLANAIVLSFVPINNNSNLKAFDLVFDSDAAEIFPSNDNNSVTVTKISNDPKSINNPNIFGKIISSGYLENNPFDSNDNIVVNTTIKNYVLSKMSLTFDTGAKWIDSNGNETKYDICAEDMFYSIKRTKLYDKEYRRSQIGGGTLELDNYFISKTQTTKIFGETQKYPNEYLFDFFGIKKELLYDKETAIQKITKNNGKQIDSFAFSFDIYNENGTIKNDFVFSVSDIISKYLINSLTFSLAPSQYIKDVYSKQFKTEVGDIKNEAREYGIYTYGQTRETTLYASCYIPTSSNSGREIYEYNKYYANKEWVQTIENGEIKNENGEIKNGKKYKGINKVIIEYTGGVDSSTFINQAFNSFLDGTTSEIDYSLLSDAQRQKLYGTSNDISILINNSENNGLRPTKNVNTSKLTSRTVWQANPTPGTNYTFNNSYSKLVYGLTLDELKSGNKTTANSFFGSFGLNFRNLIQASINWDQYIQVAYSGTRDAWLSGAAQDAIFSSTNHFSLTPSHFNEKGVNDLTFIDSTGKKQIVTLAEMKRLSSMTGEELDKEFGPGTSENINLAISKSPKYEEVKKAMKKLLDDFYALNPELENELIKWEIPYSFADQDETKCNATQYIVENVINGLDPRIKAEFFKPTSRNEMLSAINQRRGAYNANLWSYDYEGIGSFIAAFFSEGSGTNMLGAIGIFSKDINSADDSFFGNGRLTKEEIKILQEQYPRFTELSKYIAQKINAEFESNNQSYNEKKYKVENWDTISNLDMNNIVDYFVKNTLSENPNGVNPITLLPSFFKTFESESSWEKDSSLTLEQKGQEWANFIQEMNSIKGVSIDTESSVEKLTEVNYVLYLKEYIIPISKYGINLYSNFLYEVEE